MLNILESSRAADGKGQDQVVQEQESLLAKAEAERKLLGKQLMLVYFFMLVCQHQDKILYRKILSSKCRIWCPVRKKF
jgi:hypothetical protein